MDALKYLDKIKAWYSNLNDRQLIYAKTFLCAALGNVVATMVITIMHPAAGEIVQNTLITIGVVINVGLVSMSVVVFVAVAAKSAGQLVILETSGIKLLTVGAWKEPDISPDVLIAYRSGETEDEFMSRLQEAANNCGSGKWVLVIPFRYPKGMIYEKPTRYREFPRENPPFQGDDWTDGQRVCPSSTYFNHESLGDYRGYVDRFVFYFREWSFRQKIDIEENPGRKLEMLQQGIRSSLNVLFFVLFSLPVFAQNAAAVSQALGTRIREIPSSGTEVVYEFTKREITRIADGRKNYVELLKSAPMYSDSRGGDFVALYAGNRVVAKADQTGAVSYRDPVRPRGAAVPVMDKPTYFSLPDSNEMAEQVNRARETIGFYESEFWASIKPGWEFVMIVFWALFPVLGIGFVVLWFWAGLSASEEMPKIHWHSSRALVLLVGFIWTIAIVNSTLTVIWWELPTWQFIVCLFIIGGLGLWSATKIVPNIRAKPGGRTAFFDKQNGNPQLGQG